MKLKKIDQLDIINKEENLYKIDYFNVSNTLFDLIKLKEKINFKYLSKVSRMEAKEKGITIQKLWNDNFSFEVNDYSLSIINRIMVDISLNSLP